MAEKSLKEIRDDVALKVFEHLLYDAVTNHRPIDADEIRLFSSNSFKAAEIFLAARYDADKSGSRST